MKDLNNTNKTSENAEKELRISDVIGSKMTGDNERMIQYIKELENIIKEKDNIIKSMNDTLNKIGQRNIDRLFSK
jgi:hypothetical protein